MYQYLVVKVHVEDTENYTDMENEMNEAAEHGWRLVSVATGHSVSGRDYILVFEMYESRGPIPL